MFGWDTFSAAYPCEAHHSLTKLETIGIQKILVTQNVDRLHQKALTQNVIDLHGRNDIIECLSCKNESCRHEFQKTLKIINSSFISSQIHDFGNEMIRADGDANIDTSNLDEVKCLHYLKYC